jgi:pilus assembly protein Flp/PilA
MSNALRILWGDERGQDLAEYGMLVALIAIVALASLTLLGGNIDALFTTVSTTLTGVANGG